MLLPSTLRFWTWARSSLPVSFLSWARRESAHLTLTEIVGSAMTSRAPLTISPRFRASVSPLRSSLAGWGTKNAFGDPALIDHLQLLTTLAQADREVLANDLLQISLNHGPAGQGPLLLVAVAQTRQTGLQVLQAALEAQDIGLVVEAGADDRRHRFGQVGDALQRVLEGLVVQFAVALFEGVGQNQVMRDFGTKQIG